MIDSYPNGFVRCDVNINIAPPLEEPAVLKVFAGLRRTLAAHGLSHFEHEEDDKVCRLNNGGNMEARDERVVKLLKGAVLQAIWSANTAMDIGSDISRLAAEALLRNLELIQVESFNCELYIDVESAGSAYDRIDELAYNPSVVGSFYNAMRNATDNFRIGNNDLHVLFYIGESQAGAIRISGRTTKKEIMTGKFDNDPLLLFFGIQETHIPDTPDEFISSLVSHIARVHELATTVFVPSMVEKCRIQQKN